MTRDDLHLLFLFLAFVALFISPVMLIMIIIIWIGVWLSEDRDWKSNTANCCPGCITIGTDFYVYCVAGICICLGRCKVARLWFRKLRSKDDEGAIEAMAKRKLSYEDCEQCQWDEPHYHCSNCKAVTGMMGHFNFELSTFTCERKTNESVRASWGS